MNRIRPGSLKGRTSCEDVPTVLFVYRRIEKLQRVLECLKENRVPLLVVYSDAPADRQAEANVEAVRGRIRGIDWCSVDLRCWDRNLGLGRSIRRGVSEVLREHDRAIVFEDDIECVPGTYSYLCAALAAYEGDRRVMSVAGYTHPRLRPPIPGDQAFFDGRFACWGWGTWRRAWRGMQVPAPILLLLTRMCGRKAWRYGADIAATAWQERRRNLWAVRFCLLHILRGGLAFHPPWSLTNHMGFDDSTTTHGIEDKWQVRLSGNAPPLPRQWPQAVEIKDAASRFTREFGLSPTLAQHLRTICWRCRARCGAGRPR